MLDDLRSTMSELRQMFEAEDYIGVMETCHSILKQEPDHAPAVMTLALVAFTKGDEGLALQLAERAHEMAPNCREFAEVLANMHTRLGHLTTGLYFAKLATCLVADPILSEFIPSGLDSYHAALQQVGLSQHFSNAELSFLTGDFETAVKEAEEELRVNPENVGALKLVANALMKLNAEQSALSYLRAAAHLAPADPWVHALLGDALMSHGAFDQAAVHQKVAFNLAREDKGLLGYILSATCYQTDANFFDLGECWSDYEGFHRQTERLIRSVAGLPPMSELWGVLFDKCHDGPLQNFVPLVLREMGNIVLYRLNQRRDQMTDAYRHNVLRMRDLMDLDVWTLGRIIRGDQVPVLLNLSAPGPEAHYPHFAEARKRRRSSRQGSAANMLPVLPDAPTTLQWLSEPLVDRLPGAHFIIAGPETLDLDQQNFGEGRVILLDRLLAFNFPAIPSEQEQVTALPRDRSGQVTFGGLGDLRCLTPDCIALWASVLRAVPEAKLLLGGRKLWKKETEERLVNQFGDFGMAHRLRFDKEDCDGADETSFYNKIDILLDSTPVSGGAPVARALWMGVPVITLRGRRRIGRLAASILHAAGLTQWIARDGQDFVAIAEGLASNWGLGKIRAELRKNVETSPLADVSGFAKHLAQAVKNKLGGAD